MIEVKTKGEQKSETAEVKVVVSSSGCGSSSKGVTSGPRPKIEVHVHVGTQNQPAEVEAQKAEEDSVEVVEDEVETVTEIVASRPGFLGPRSPPKGLLAANCLVTRNPAGALLEGLWSGPSGITWRRVEESFRGGRLWGSGAKVKKVSTLEEALALWRKEKGELALLRQWRVTA